MAAIVHEETQSEYDASSEFIIWLVRSFMKWHSEKFRYGKDVYVLMFETKLAVNILAESAIIQEDIFDCFNYSQVIISN